LYCPAKKKIFFQTKEEGLFPLPEDLTITQQGALAITLLFQMQEKVNDIFRRDGDAMRGAGK